MKTFVLAALALPAALAADLKFQHGGGNEAKITWDGSVLEIPRE